MAKKLVPPKKLTINFSPSLRQYSVWKAINPGCFECGGEIESFVSGYDKDNNPIYESRCTVCGSKDIPQRIMCGGSAGGGKSYLMSCWLIGSCIRWADVRMGVGRKTLKALKGSTWLTIGSVLKEWGLKEGENYKVDSLNLIVTFWNGSTITGFELDDLPSDPECQRYGSIELTGMAIDELSQISENTYNVICSRIRYNVVNTFGTPKCVSSCNPCNNWVKTRFVMDVDGNDVVCKDNEKYIPFSLFDNPNKDFVRQYSINLRNIADPATRNRLLYGDWRFVSDNAQACYGDFNADKHLMEGLREKVYDPLKPIVASVDFNVAPHMSGIFAQIDYDNKRVYVLEEILGNPENKENNTPAYATKIANNLNTKGHYGGVTITGDPSGKSRSTQTEDGVNNFTILTSKMKENHLISSVNTLSKQPPQKTRLEWINEMLRGENREGWRILIDSRCNKLINDFAYHIKNEDGTKNKTKKTDPKTGVKYEPYGHMDDCFDYLLCTMLKNNWSKFNQTTGDDTPPVTTSQINSGWGY